MAACPRRGRRENSYYVGLVDLLLCHDGLRHINAPDHCTSPTFDNMPRAVDGLIGAPFAAPSLFTGSGIHRKGFETAMLLVTFVLLPGAAGLL